jgi:hypothetical protein
VIEKQLVRACLKVNSFAISRIPAHHWPFASNPLLLIHYFAVGINPAYKTDNLDGLKRALNTFVKGATDA